MFKKISAVIIMSALICSMFAGCKSSVSVSVGTGNSTENSITSESKTDDDSEEGSEESEDEEEIDTRTESIDGINYSISGKIFTASVFENGPHDYSFERFSAVIDGSFEYNIDFSDTEAIANLASEYAAKKEINNFVVSDLSSDQIDIDSLGKTGAIITFNTVNDTDMTVYYKVLVFDTGFDPFDEGVTSAFVAEFSSFYDDREEVVNAELDKFMSNLSAE